MLKLSSFLILSLFACGAYADDFAAMVADTKSKCSQISAQLNDLKKMAGINTAVTGVGTATATGATIVGIAKSSLDEELERILEPLKDKTPRAENPDVAEIERVFDSAGTGTKTSEKLNIAEMEQKSKDLGNWRTGLLGASTATNVAGAVIAGGNKVDEDLKTQIDNCIKSVDALQGAVGQARMDGVEVGPAQKIITECSKWKEADLSVIDKRAEGAKWSSIVGAGTGLAGTITSAIANSDKTRSGDAETEKNLNTTSNILAGGTAVAGGVATVFNATQISAIKKIVNIAEECEETLK